VRYIAAKRKLYVGTGAQHITIQEKGWLKQNEKAGHKLSQVSTASIVSGSVFAAIVGRAQKRSRKNGPDGTQIFSVSMADINKALSKLAERKQKQTVEQIQAELSTEITEHTDAFLDDKDGSLPPHCGTRDHAIELIHNV
jgi:hypothetical protein